MTSSLSLARSIHDDRNQLRGNERCIAERRFSYALTEADCHRSIARLRNTIAREQSQLADLLTPVLGSQCPQCAPGNLEPSRDGALECSECGELAAVECGSVVHVSTCETCSELAVTADCLSDGDDLFCSECSESAAEARYQRTGCL